MSRLTRSIYVACPCPAKFFKAWTTDKDPDVRYMLDLIGELYGRERHYQKLKLTPDGIRLRRNNGRYSIGNNIAERFMKPLVNGRNNSYFYGSDKMANVSAVYHTLISTCKPVKVSVSEYFSKVFAKIVRGCTDYSSMLPMNMDLSTNKY